MSFVIRNVAENDLDAILALNNAAGIGILPLDTARLRWLYDHAEYFRVAEREGQLLGVLLAFGHDSPYDSRNLRWFAERYPRFLYIDRVIVNREHRGSGVGRALYADVLSYAEPRYPELCCEVFIQEGMNPALLFHGSFGFHEVGQNMQVDGHRASMLMKPLCSHEWIWQTYGGNLPEEPWVLSSRLPSRSPGACHGVVA